MKQCSYCGSSFKTISSLNAHIRTAKYCLKRRGKVNSYYKCVKCNKTFSTKNWMENHMRECIGDYDTMKNWRDSVTLDTERVYMRLELAQERIAELEGRVEELTQDNKELQEKIANIALKASLKPTSVNKTNINNFFQGAQAITPELLERETSHLTLQHIEKGVQGYAEYALKYPFKDKIVCIDYARRKIKFKDEKGNIITDPEMQKLAKMLFSSVTKKSSEIINSLRTENMSMEMFDRLSELFEILAHAKNTACGMKGAFYHDFVKNVCAASLLGEEGGEGEEGDIINVTTQ